MEKRANSCTWSNRERLARRAQYIYNKSSNDARSSQLPHDVAYVAIQSTSDSLGWRCFRSKRAPCYEWNRSQARSHRPKNSSRFWRCVSGLSRPAPKGPRREVLGPCPNGGVAPSSYSALVLLLVALRLPSDGRWPGAGDGGVGGWCPP